MNIKYIHKIKSHYFSEDNKYNLFIVFALKVVVVYYLLNTFFNIYTGLITPGGTLELNFLIKYNFYDFVKKTIVSGAFILLKLFNFDVFKHGYIVGISGTGGVEIADPCLGIKVWITITTLVSCFPGKWKVKLSYIGASILFLHFLNIVRISALAILAQYDVDLENHHSIYNIVIYLFVALLFLGYVECFSEKGKEL